MSTPGEIKMTMPEDTEKINKELGQEKEISPGEVIERGKLPEEEREKVAEVPEAEKRPEVEISEEKPGPAPVTPPAEEEVKQQVESLKTLDKEHQVKVLTDLAFQKGLAFSIKVARSLDSDYVLDKFHGSLVDELYKELVESGKLKKL